VQAMSKHPCSKTVRRRRWRASRPFPDNLTRREVEVLRLLAAGRINKEIAHALGLSVHTVDAHVASLYAKIGARNRAAASRSAPALPVCGIGLGHRVTPPVLPVSIARTMLRSPCGCGPQ
jgi:DNA-binding CsgD family transcriptional regulator